MQYFSALRAGQKRVAVAREYLNKICGGKIGIILLDSLCSRNLQGSYYDTDEINSWLEYEGSWKDAKIRTRITNISHYAQSRHQQSDNLHIIEDDSCGCGGSC